MLHIVTSAHQWVKFWVSTVVTSAHQSVNGFGLPGIGKHQCAAGEMVATFPLLAEGKMPFLDYWYNVIIAKISSGVLYLFFYPMLFFFKLLSSELISVLSIVVICELTFIFLSCCTGIQSLGLLGTMSPRSSCPPQWPSKRRHLLVTSPCGGSVRVLRTWTSLLEMRPWKPQVMLSR